MSRGGYNVLVWVSLCFFLSGCSVFVQEQQDGMPSAPKDVSHVTNAVPKHEPKSRYGNPKSYKVFGKRYHVLDSHKGYQARGIASWYGTKFHGRRTSSGEPYDMYQMTAAHKSLPLPTYAKVRNLDNGKEIIVKINDRGPFHEGRIIDLSYAAANKLGILGKGTGNVEVTAITPGESIPNDTDGPIVADAAPAATVQVASKADEDVYLQVGAFSNQIRAEALANKLKQSGHTVLIKTANTATLPVYKVQVAVLDRTKVSQLSSELSSLTNSSPMVILQ